MSYSGRKSLGTLKSREVFNTILTSFKNDALLSKADCDYLIRRVTCEGERFLLIELPLYAKALEKAICDRVAFFPLSFKRYKKKGITTSLTCLFKEKLSLIFDNEGTLLESVDPNELIRVCNDIRQVCYSFHKIEYTFDKSELMIAEKKFLATDDAVKEDFSDLTIRELSIFDIAKNILSELFKDFTLRDVLPRHGNGASAEKLTQAERRRYDNYTIYGDLNERYPAYSFIFPNSRSLAANAELYWSAKARGYGKKGISRFCCVPKDARGPRTINIEPHEYMWVQQGQMKLMYNYIENHPLTKGFINFTDQSINQNMAKKGSITGVQCTLDLKDASDLVSNELVRKIFPKHMVPDLMASRTGKVFLPTHNYVRFLKKYASMGNAMCFPIEAIVFWTLAKATAEYYNLSENIFVYGDDIICNDIIANQICLTLEAFGLKVNSSKSFLRGHFRESCGGDFIHGHNVTPIRIRKLDSNLESLLSIHKTAQQFFEKGLWHTARLFDNYAAGIAKSFGLKYGFSEPVPRLALASLQSFSKSNDIEHVDKPRYRINKSLHYKEVKLPEIKVVSCKTEYINADEAYLCKLTHGWANNDDTPEMYRYPILTGLYAKNSWVSTYSPLHSSRVAP